METTNPVRLAEGLPTTDPLPNPWAAGLTPEILAFCREVSRQRALEVLEVLRKRFPEGETPSESDIEAWQETWFMAACRMFALEDGTRIESGLWLKHVRAVKAYCDEAQHHGAEASR